MNFKIFDSQQFPYLTYYRTSSTITFREKPQEQQPYSKTSNVTHLGANIK